MRLTERDRAVLLRTLEDVLGQEAAEILMTQFPPGGWDDLVTKDDLARTGSDLGARMDGLETRMDGLETRMDGLETRMEGLETRMDGLDAKIDRVEERLNTRIDHVEEKMDERFQAVHHALDRNRHEVVATIRGEMISAVTRQTRTIIFTMAGTVVSLMGFTFGLEHLA